MVSKKKDDMSNRVISTLQRLTSHLESQPGLNTSLHYGLSITSDQNGEITFKEFGHLLDTISDKKEKDGGLRYSPLIEFQESDDSLKAAILLPGIPRENISLTVEPKEIELTLDMAGGGSKTRFKLPGRTEPSSARCLLSNGILYVNLTKMKKKAKVKQRKHCLGANDITEDSASLDYFERELEEKTRLCDDYLKKLIRVQNDFVNYRDRTLKEKNNYLDSAKEDLILALLPVVDNFERALESSKTSSDAAACLTGIEMIRKQIFDIFKSEGLEPIPTQGVAFDPNIHDALITEESSDHRDGEIMAEIERGYIFKGKVLRTSKVKVAKDMTKKER